MRRATILLAAALLVVVAALPALAQDARPAPHAYARVLATPKDARPQPEAAWLEGAARIDPCLREGRCGTP